MKIARFIIAASVLAVTASAATAQMGDGHKIISPQDITWSPGPPSLPPGVVVSVLYGDPGRDGPFAMRAKMPKGYRIGPHTHAKPEIVTMLSGTSRLGMGETADPAKAQVLSAGSFFVMDPGMVHYFSVDEETVIQVNSTGPWSITYVDPKDDPQRKTQ